MFLLADSIRAKSQQQPKEGCSTDSLIGKKIYNERFSRLMPETHMSEDDDFEEEFDEEEEDEFGDEDEVDDE